MSNEENHLKTWSNVVLSAIALALFCMLGCGADATSNMSDSKRGKTNLEKVGSLAPLKKKRQSQGGGGGGTPSDGKRPVITKLAKRGTVLFLAGDLDNRTNQIISAMKDLLSEGQIAAIEEIVNRNNGEFDRLYRKRQAIIGRFDDEADADARIERIYNRTKNIRREIHTEIMNSVLSKEQRQTYVRRVEERNAFKAQEAAREALEAKENSK